MSGRGWLAWFVLSFGSFLFFEVTALARRRDDLTLSAAIWRMEHLRDGEHVWQWNAAHFLFIAVFVVTMVWLFGHFGWGLWR
jgi:hypothetical protein